MKLNMILLYLLVAAAYVAGAMLEWRRLGRVEGGDHEPATPLARWLPLLAIAGHAILITRVVFASDGLDLSLPNALSAVAGMVALFAWVGAQSRALPGVGAIALVVAAFAALLPAAFPNPHRFSISDEPWAALHIAVALVALSLLIVAGLEALLLMGVERRLHRGLPDPTGGTMPPLLTMERFLFRLVGVGYALLTVTMLSGIFFSEQVFGKPLTFTHKIVFSVLGWLVFGVFLVGRQWYGWRGRKALVWILSGSILLLVAYLGSKFVLEVLLKR